MSAIQRAVDLIGSQSEMGRRLGIKPQAVQKWISHNRVPAERVLQIEKLTGISRHDLRPDIYPRERA